MNEIKKYLYSCFYASSHQTNKDSTSSMRNAALDLVICFSTAPGNYSVRSITGTPFIEVFCKYLREGASIDSIMKCVTAELSNKSFRIEHDADIISINISAQMETSLRKNLIF